MNGKNKNSLETAVIVMTCSFIGHRKVNETPELKEKIKQTVCDIIESGVTVFFVRRSFGI